MSFQPKELNMPETVYAWVCVYDCPVDKRGEAAQAVIDFEIYEDEPSEGDDVALGYRYSSSNVHLETPGYLATRLDEIGCTFEVGREPREDNQGMLWRGVPGLGVHQAAHHEGDVYVCDRALARALETATSRCDLDAKICALIGSRWEEVIGPLRKEDA
jgi:hypothetical protein